MIKPNLENFYHLFMLHNLDTKSGSNPMSLHLKCLSLCCSSLDSFSKWPNKQHTSLKFKDLWGRHALNESTSWWDRLKVRFCVPSSSFKWTWLHGEQIVLHFFFQSPCQLTWSSTGIWDTSPPREEASRTSQVKTIVAQREGVYTACHEWGGAFPSHSV